jgi:hypothetical protein
MYLYPQVCLAAVRGALRYLLLAGGAAAVGVSGAVAEQGARGREQQRFDEANRRETEALVELVDRAADGQGGPAGLVLDWRHDFLKAQPGTFVPFIVSVAPGTGGGPLARQALMYVRAARRETAGAAVASERRKGRPRYAFDAVFAVDLTAEPGQPAHVTRGFAVPAGDYDVFVAVSERPADPLDEGRAGEARAAVIRRGLRVPDFWSGELMTSTVMLARRIRKLSRTLGPEEALERPYAIGLNDVDVAIDSTFRQDGELIVVFVIYNPAVSRDGEFDVMAEYHVYRRGFSVGGDAPAGVPPARPGERYVTRTDPQRFNIRTLGRQLDSQAGHPVMAGQGILLSSFDIGDYRLGITVRDLLSGETVTRDVTFRVEAAAGVEARPRSAQ